MLLAEGLAAMCGVKVHVERNSSRSLCGRNGMNSVLRPAAVGGAIVGPRVVGSQRQPRRGGIEPLDDQLADHTHKTRMIGHHVGSDHVDAQLVAESCDLHVEVVDDFQVLRQETDRRDDDVLDALGSQVADAIVDVGFEPRLRRRPAAALENQVPRDGLARPLALWERVRVRAALIWRFADSEIWNS